MVVHYKNLIIIGTSHIAKQSVNEINSIFSEINPDIVCVELDHKRLHALLTDAKPDYSLAGITRYGLQGYLFAVIAGLLQKKLGNIVGIKPGSDMLAAVNLSREHNKQLILIDQDIEITLKKFSKQFTFKEKMRILWDVIRSPFAPKLKINLNHVPKEELIIKMISELKSRYPSLYNVLIHERNIVMTKALVKIIENDPEKKILAVIGAGHEKEMIELIKKEENKRDKIY